MKIYFIFLIAALYSFAAQAMNCHSPLDVESELRRNLSFAKDVAVDDRADLQQFVEEAETIFDQGVRRVGLEFHHDLYWITRFESTANRAAVLDGPFFYRVEKIGGGRAVPQSIRLRQTLKTGGLSKILFVKDRVLKDSAILFPLTEPDEPIAVRMLDLEKDRAYFSVFQDHRRPRNISFREIYDVTYARRYTISRELRAKLQSNKQVTLIDIDQGFAHWNGNDKLDLFINKEGVVVPRPPPDPNKTVTDGVFRWFLSRDAAGEWLRVVIIRRSSRRLPEIVTAYRPSEAELKLLREAGR